MNRLSPSAARFDDEALDRALLRTGVPDVPSGLADRIVAAVTVLPQEAPERTRANLPREPARQRPALAASIAVAVVLGGGALGLWHGADRERPAVPAEPPAIAEAPPTAADRDAAIASAAHEGSRPAAFTIGAAKRGNERPAAAHSELERAEHDPVPSAAPGALPDAAPDSVENTGVVLASEAGPSTPVEHLSAPDNSAGPSLAGSAGLSPSSPDGAVYGPPAPRGLGIAGSGPSQAPSTGPVGTGPNGTGPTGPGPSTGPTGRGPVGPGPGARR